MICLFFILLLSPPEREFQKTWDEMQVFLKKEHAERSVDSVLQFFLDLPYLVGSLEGEGPEELRYRLDGFDCFTLTEAVMAFCLLKEPTQHEYEDWIRRTRYRDGEINGYASRIHYATEWSDQAVKMGLLTDVTGLSSRAIKWQKEINFMSTHRNAYPKLADEKTYRQIQQIEKGLSTRERLYIPMSEVSNQEGFFRKGDIVLILTAKDGLDAGHFCYIIDLPPSNSTKEPITAIHASSTQKKVVLAEDMVVYLNQYPRGLGIMVFRLKKG